MSIWQSVIVASATSASPSPLSKFLSGDRPFDPLVEPGVPVHDEPCKFASGFCPEQCSPGSLELNLLNLQFFLPATEVSVDLAFGQTDRLERLRWLNQVSLSSVQKNPGPRLLSPSDPETIP